MYIKEISLRDFRNYESLDVQFHNKVNIFLGQNAQGKTNLLESIYITSMGKSFRTGKDRDMVRFGSEFFRVKATAVKEEELIVEIAVTKDGIIILTMSDEEEKELNG
jgi:DNA replication and repair protein RecF